MDELVVEGKKYISSKRAAKITGYAKDYIGQMCREGRVVCRLVGRSWYVSETAIRQHRFGKETDDKREKPRRAGTGFSDAWKVPRYEADNEKMEQPIALLQKVNKGATTDADPTGGRDSAEPTPHKILNILEQRDADTFGTVAGTVSAEETSKPWHAWIENVTSQVGNLASESSRLMPTNVALSERGLAPAREESSEERTTHGQSREVQGKSVLDNPHELSRRPEPVQTRADHFNPMPPHWNEQQQTLHGSQSARSNNAAGPRRKGVRRLIAFLVFASTLILLGTVLLASGVVDGLMKATTPLPLSGMYSR